MPLADCMSHAVAGTYLLIRETRTQILLQPSRSHPLEPLLQSRRPRPLDADNSRRLAAQNPEVAVPQALSAFFPPSPPDNYWQASEKASNRAAQSIGRDPRGYLCAMTMVPVRAMSPSISFLPEFYREGEAEGRLVFRQAGRTCLLTLSISGFPISMVAVASWTGRSGRTWWSFCRVVVTPRKTVRVRR